MSPLFHVLHLHIDFRLTVETFYSIHSISSEGPQQSIKNKNKNVPLDSITARTYLTSALTQFLGLMGSSIGIDILKISDGGSDHVSSDQALAAGNKNQNKTDHPLLWIRVPRDDAPAVVAALSSWVGGNGSGESATGNGNVSWRICAKGNFLAAIVNGSGEDLFR